ncbi:hypothetical protein [Gallibacterium sp. ZY190522]
MKTKLSILKEYAAKNDWDKVIKMAARFQRLGNDKNAILSADMALKHPNFCISLKKSPDELIKIGIETLKRKYNL